MATELKLQSTKNKNIVGWYTEGSDEANRLIDRGFIVLETRGGGSGAVSLPVEFLDALVEAREADAAVEDAKVNDETTGSEAGNPPSSPGNAEVSGIG